MSNDNTQAEGQEVEVNALDVEVDALMKNLDENEFTGTQYTDSEKEALGEIKAETVAKDPEDDEDLEPGAEVDVPVGPVVEFKVDGEEKSMTLEEIQKNHPEVLEDLKAGVSGAKKIAQKFTELDKEKKSFYDEKKEFAAEKRAIEEYIEQSRSRLENGNIEDSVKVLAELGGIPFYQYKAQLLQWALPQLVAQQDMTPEQIRIQELEAERAYEREQQESRTKRAEAEQTQSELIESINDVRETHKITDEEWDNALINASKQFKDLQVENVVSVVLEQRIDSQAQEVISEIEEFPKESTDTLRAIIANNPDFDKETIKEIVTKALEQSKAVNEQSSVEKEVAEKIGSKLKPTKSKKDEEDEELSRIDAMIKRNLG